MYRQIDFGVINSWDTLSQLMNFILAHLLFQVSGHQYLWFWNSNLFLDFISRTRKVNYLCGRFEVEDRENLLVYNVDCNLFIYWSFQYRWAVNTNIRTLRMHQRRDISCANNLIKSRFIVINQESLHIRLFLLLNIKSLVWIKSLC